VRTPRQRREHLQVLDEEKARLAAGGLVWDAAYDAKQWGISRREVMAEAVPQGRAYVSETAASAASKALPEKCGAHAPEALSERDTKLAQKLGQLQPFIAAFPHEYTG
jgi:hypothetical protein